MPISSASVKTTNKAGLFPLNSSQLHESPKVGAPQEPCTCCTPCVSTMICGAPGAFGTKFGVRLQRLVVPGALRLPAITSPTRVIAMSDGARPDASSTVRAKPCHRYHIDDEMVRQVQWADVEESSHQVLWTLSKTDPLEPKAAPVPPLLHGAESCWLGGTPDLSGCWLCALLSQAEQNVATAEEKGGPPAAPAAPAPAAPAAPAPTRPKAWIAFRSHVAKSLHLESS